MVEEQEPGYGNRDETAVDNAVPYELVIWSKDVATFAEAPAYWIKHPNEPYPACTYGVCEPSLASEMFGVALRIPNKIEEQCEPGSAPESVVACFQEGDLISDALDHLSSFISTYPTCRLIERSHRPLPSLP